MKHLVWLALSFTPLAAAAQQIGGEIRLPPARKDGATLRQSAFYVGTFLNPKTLLHLELGIGYLQEHYEIVSGGLVERIRTESATPTLGFGIRQTMFTWPKQRMTANLGLLATLPLQASTQVDLTKYRLFGSAIGIRLGLGAGYTRHLSEYFSRKGWLQISYLNLGVFCQII